ncbi:NADH-quinone oxidoreductase subunit H, partial [Candidatus Altiarchaeota archaeon]
MISLVLTTMMSLALGVACGLLIPGIERKVHARIQQRVGPPITTPGFWNVMKFLFKKRITPNSPNPALYHLVLTAALACVLAVLAISTPAWWGILGFASVLGVAGLLKVEESVYVFMGSLADSVMSVRMPANDMTRYASFKDAVRTPFERVSAVRSLKMITLGSFPFYIALFIPFVKAGGVGFADVGRLSWPVIGSLSGLLGAATYFIGYNIMTNNRPFDIIKPKVDIIEGGLMEYAAAWRGMYYVLSGVL